MEFGVPSAKIPFVTFANFCVARSRSLQGFTHPNLEENKTQKAAKDAENGVWRAGTPSAKIPCGL